MDNQLTAYRYHISVADSLNMRTDSSNCSSDKDCQTTSDLRWSTLDVFDETDKTIALDKAWQFHLGDVKEAYQMVFEDSAWETVDLPHDFSISQGYSPAGEAESAYKLSDTGWYRKSFTVSSRTKKGRIILCFDGSYLETSVYINGHYLGLHPYGYTPFSFDITDFVVANMENTIAIKVENPIPNSRWYSSGGLYRLVSLRFEPLVHLEEYGVVVRTISGGKSQPCAIEVETRIANDTDLATSVVLDINVYDLNQSSLPDSRLASGLQIAS